MPVPLPPSLRKLRAVRDRCEKDGLSLQAIGLELLDEDYRSEVTPPDLLPFARTGADGVHFGLLTNFGSTPNLEKAPVVCVSPTNDPPVTLVAASVKDFVALVSLVGDADALDGIPDHPDRGRGWLAQLRARAREDGAELRKARRGVLDRLKYAFGAPSLKSAIRHVQQVRQARARQVAVPTDDDLGVLPFRRRRGTKVRFERPDPDLSADPARLKAFLKTAEAEQVLALVRDAAFHQLPHQSIATLARALTRLGLREERNRWLAGQP